MFSTDRPRTEDEQLQDAIAASLQEQGLTTATAPQESGVLAATNDMNRQYFGPANRPNYDEKSWAMVRTTAKSFDPPPSQRKREMKVPVFLLCRLEQQRKHRLGPLLMVLHAIPAARNFFLLLDGSSPSYGDHKEWWKGEHIFAKAQNPAAWAAEYQDISLVDELQRLVAFLDQTDRSYGTADSLCETHLIKSTWGGDQILTFYECLYGCASPQQLPRLWTFVKIENTSGETRPQEFAILDFRIPEDTLDVLRNLHSQWDNLFWIHQENGWPGWQGRQDEKLPQIASIQTPAQIMTMRIQVDGTGSAFEVPEILYIDRYLESNVDKARTMQHTMFRMWRACDVAREKEIAVSQWKDPATGQVVDRTQLAKKVIKRSEDEIWRIRSNALWRLHEESIGTEAQIPFLPDELNHLAQLNEDEDKAVKHFQAKIGLAEATLARIDRKLASKLFCDSLSWRVKISASVPFWPLMSVWLIISQESVKRRGPAALCSRNSTGPSRCLAKMPSSILRTSILYGESSRRRTCSTCVYGSSESRATSAMGMATMIELTISGTRLPGSQTARPLCSKWYVFPVDSLQSHLC